MRSATLAAALAAGAVLLAAPARAAEVSREATVDAAPAKVWEMIGPFCSIARWHPVIASCAEEKAEGGTARRLVTKDGGVLLEKLTAHDDKAMSYSYAIIDSPLPVQNYRSTISVADAGGGKSKVTWKGDFDPKGAATADQAQKVVAGIYDAGLDGIRAKAK